MTEAPHLTPRAAADLDARQRREAAALRRNLLLRKQQLRSREAAPTDVPVEPDEPRA